MIKDRKLYQELGCKSIKDYLRKKFPFYTLTFLIGLSHLVEKIDDISQLKEVSWSSVEPLVKAANDTDVAYIDNSEGKVTLKGNQEMTLQEYRELVDSRHEKEKTELKNKVKNGEKQTKQYHEKIKKLETDLDELRDMLKHVAGQHDIPDETLKKLLTKTGAISHLNELAIQIDRSIIQINALAERHPKDPDIARNVYGIFTRLKEGQTSLFNTWSDIFFGHGIGRGD